MSKRFFYTVDEEKACGRVAEELSSHELFQSFRGTLREGNSAIDRMKRSADETDSPTACLENFEEYAGQLKVLVNLGAKIKRDHGVRAANRYFHVLANKHARFPGERLPESELRSVTVLMYAPAKTMAVIDCVLRFQTHYLQNLVNFGKKMADDFQRDETGDEKRIVESLIRDYPKLLKVSGKARALPDNFLTRALEAVWWRNTARDFEKRIQWFPNHPERSYYLRLQARHAYPKAIGTRDEFRQDGSLVTIVDPRILGEAPFIRLLEGDPELVYEEFKGSELRKELAVWKFRVPKDFPMIQGVGLHPAAEHAAWARQWPLFASQNTEAGYGLVLLNNVNVMEPRYLDGCYVPTLNEVGEQHLRLSFGACRVPADQRVLGRNGKQYL